MNDLTSLINLELDNISEWLSINKLSLNVKKTKYMIFHTKQKNISNIKLDLEINKHPIERVHDFNFLGLTIDENVSWKEHIQKVSAKVSRTLGALCRLKRYLPETILRLLYNYLVLPHLQYGILIWGFKPGRLFKLQKRAMRIITNSRYNAHTEPIFRRLNLLKLDDIFRCNALRFVYNLFNDRLPSYFIDTLLSNGPNHVYPTRVSHALTNNLRQYRITTSGAKECMRYYVPKLLNDTDCIITDKIFSHSYHGFSRYVKQYAINHYCSGCNVLNCYVCNTQNHNETIEL